ncbi:uncharacterized protein PG998_011138 [Apiospora kogelbergensis]|uniref:uncharacterized protein n=1 Tax=Apiospora kogelbergensis TaxID=1337665 RepID=UPI00312CDD6E
MIVHLSSIRMEDANIGVFTADANAEAGQTRFVGYTSGPAGSPVSIAAIDVDVCTGEATYRSVVTAAVDATQPRTKFDQRLRAQAGDRYAREYRILTSAPTKLTKNNITAGQYVQPVTEWIQPELTSPGVAPVAHDFSGFGHLTNGLGRDANGDIWGPLDPFPQSNVKVFDVSSCLQSPPPLSPTTSAPAATATTITPPPPPKDAVRVTVAGWASSNGGTLTVMCVSSNTNANQVVMMLDYVQNGVTVSNVVMTASSAGTPGSWDFSGQKIKKTVTSVTCRSKLGVGGGNAHSEEKARPPC